MQVVYTDERQIIFHRIEDIDEDDLLVGRQGANALVETWNEPGHRVPASSRPLRRDRRQPYLQAQRLGFLNHPTQRVDRGVGAAANLRTVEQIVGAFHQQEAFGPIALDGETKPFCAIDGRFSRNSLVDHLRHLKDVPLGQPSLQN